MPDSDSQVRVSDEFGVSFSRGNRTFLADVADDLAHLLQIVFFFFLQAKKALCDQKNAPHALTTTLLLSNSSPILLKTLL